MNEAERIVDAWEKAQAAFKAMIVAGVYGDRDAPETQAYTAAERNLDSVLDLVQLNRRLDRGHDPDCDCYHIARQQLEETMRAEAEGDHFAYPSVR